MSTPENQWGQAAVNNTTGFGKGAGTATNGWGTIHPITWGHPNTNLVGGAVLPTDGLMWSSWDPTTFVSASVNSGSGYDFVAANGDYIQLNQTITLNQQYCISFIVDAKGSGGFLFGNSVSNAPSLQLQQSVGNYRINFTIGSTNYLSQFFDLNLKYVEIIGDEIAQELRLYADGVLLETTPFVVSGSFRNFDVICRRGGASFGNFEVYLFKIEQTNLGITNTFDFFQTDGNTLYPREFATTGLTGTVNGASPITGSIYGEQLYEWGYNYYDTLGALDPNGTVVITGDFSGAMLDINGNVISRPGVSFVDNCPKYANHYRQLETVANADIDTSGDLSFAHWFAIPSGTDGGTEFTNGNLIVTVDAVNVTLSRDGGTTTATYAHNASILFVAWLSQSSGNTDVWIGTAADAPIEGPTGLAAGSAAAGTQPMYQNNTQALSGRMSGYNALAGVYDRIISPDEIQAIWQFTKPQFAFLEPQFLIDNQGNQLVDDQGNELTT